MIRLTPPIRFVAIVMTLWIGLRILFWTPTDAPSLLLRQPGPFLPGLPALPFPNHQPVAGGDAGARQTDHETVRIDRNAGAADPVSSVRAVLSTVRLAQIPPPHRPQECGARCTQNMLAAYMPPLSQPMLMRFARRSSYIPAPRTDSAPAPRFSLSAWAQWRSGDGIGALASDGELGGSQTGIRARYRVLDAAGAQAALSARLSRPIERDGGAEAAIGIALRPTQSVPFEVTLDRRIALDGGGRDAWSLGVAGGLNRQPLAFGLELDGYAQAGIVGANSRDLYADGALIVSRPIASDERRSVSLGAAVWAGAQPGASRVDIGPEASVRLPAGDGGIRLSVSWRERIAGSAAPGSGPVIALGADF